MATDNTTLNAGTGGDTIRDLADSTGAKWPVAVACYATTVSAGANVLEPVTPTTPLPVTGTVAVSGSVPVTGTFYQATQPISGTITADQGGTWTVGVSGDVTVVGTGTLAVQASQTGTWTVGISGTPTVAVSGTVPVSGTFWQATQPVSGTVTADQGGVWSVGLAAGAAVVGQIAAGDQLGVIYSGAAALTPVTAPINVSASGNTTVVAAVAGKRIYVLRWSVRASGPVTIQWLDTAAAVLSGPRPLVAYASDGGDYCPASIYQTGVGNGLVLDLSAAVAVGGELTYVVV